MNKKTISLIGIIVGALFVLVGILAMCGALGGGTSYPGNAPANFDSGYASFGGDYYTYSVNNSAETASAARTTAGNLDDISNFLKVFCGLFSIGFGLLSMCGFGIVYTDCCKKEKEFEPILEEEIEEIFEIAEESATEDVETNKETTEEINDEAVFTEEISEDIEEKQE